VSPTRNTLDQRQAVVDRVNTRIEDLLSPVRGIEVQRDRESADYRLVVRVRHDNGDQQLLLVSAYTLFLVPIWVRDDYVTDFELVDSKGQMLGKRRFKHSHTVAWHLVFAPVCFFFGNAQKTMWDSVLGAGSEWASQLVAQNVGRK